MSRFFIPVFLVLPSRLNSTLNSLRVGILELAAGSTIKNDIIADMSESLSFEEVQKSVCAEYSLPVDNPLGKGAESVVYAYDSETILKLYRKMSTEYLQSLQDLMQRLERANLSFATSSIKSIHERDGIFYTFERRLSGITFKDWFPRLDVAGEHAALTQYIQTPSVRTQW